METVECSNCGDLGPAFFVTLGALVIAAIAPVHANGSGKPPRLM